MMIDSALAAHVAGRLDCPLGEAERRLDQRDPMVVQFLERVTILDPAAGSGAFLLGALERLATIIAPDGHAKVSVRRRVLQRSLFGVDQSAAAIRLAELRLWLALIADDAESRPERVDPLPNLDCLVRQGDSLFEPAHGTRLPAPEPELAAEVVEVRRRLIAATGASKRALSRALSAAECRVANSSLQQAEAETRARITECLAMGRSIDLFGQPRGADLEVRRCLAEHRAILRALRSARRTVTRDRELPWFHYQTHFADVFTSGGFDLVVGNPPWLRAEHVPRETRQRLAGRYRWWRASGSGFGHQPDLSVAFLERSVELAAPGGVIALLIPAKLATAAYGAASRHALAASTTVICAANLTGRPEAAFDATVYPLALIARKAVPPAGHRVFTSLGPMPSTAHNRGTIAQTRFQGGGPWVLSAGAADAIATRLRREHPSVADRFRCQLGVKTGANELFLDPPSDLTRTSIRWALRGRDLRPFQARRRVRLLWTHGPHGEPLECLPPDVAAYLAPHHAVLCRRADYTGGPAWTLFRTRAATSAHRVVWADLARRLAACALTGSSDREHIPLNTCYVAAAASADSAERLASWLNAGPVRAIAHIGAMPAAGGFRRFSAGVVSALPLPATVLDDATLSTLAAAGRRGECVQEELDEAAASHLGLSARDRRKLTHDVDDTTPHRR
jgi:methylase of polypeptide subunit release factors